MDILRTQAGVCTTRVQTNRSARIRAELDRWHSVKAGPTSAKFWETSADIGHIWLDIGQVCADFGRVWAEIG